MSTQAVTPDPYAEFQQPAQSSDPYSEFQAPAGVDTGASSSQANFGTPPPDRPGMTPLTAGIGPSTAQPHLGSSVNDVVDTVGSHLANMVTAPYHALVDDPNSPDEQAQLNANGRTGLVLDRVLGVTASKRKLQDAAAKIRARDYNGAANDAMDAIPVVGPWARNIENETRDKGAVAGMAGLATDILAPKGLGKVGGTVLGKITAPAAKLDEVIPGDTVTPRQQFADAQAHGVNLDRAQATGGAVPKVLKKVTEHSLGGRAPFEANTEANLNALNDWAGEATNPDGTPANPAVNPHGQPVEPLMSREDFGNEAKNTLSAHQKQLNDQAGAIYGDLTKRVGGVTPDTTNVSDMAQKIASENGDYYAEHPELLKGGAGSAWSIVNDLGRTEAAPAQTIQSGILDEQGKPYSTYIPAQSRMPSTWTDLHRLRSDLMDRYRSPEIAGTRAEGWLKQLTGAIDDSMTGAGSKLSASDLNDFRNANGLYKRMKDTYDNPQHPFYHVVRSPDGLTAANTIHGLKPELARQFTQAAEDVGKGKLTNQMQRQTISRILDPNGDGTPDLKGLPARLNKANAEQLQGVLTPEQLKDLQSLARTSRLVYADSNPSGTAKVVQPYVEGSAALSGIGSALAHAASGDLGTAAQHALPAAAIGGERVAAKALTSPNLTARAFSPGINGAEVASKVENTARTNAVTADSEHSPDSHSFSVSRWLKANPTGDPDEAAKEAARQGFAVIE